MPLEGCTASGNIHKNWQILQALLSARTGSLYNKYRYSWHNYHHHLYKPNHSYHHICRVHWIQYTTLFIVYCLLLNQLIFVFLYRRKDGSDACLNSHSLFRIRWNYAAVRDVTPFRVIQGHRVRYQLKAHIRLCLVINSNLAPIVHRFGGITFDRSNIATFGYPFVFNSPDGGFQLPFCV